MKELFYNGDIITMESPLYVEALLVENGKIAYAGPLSGLEKSQAGGAIQTDLQGKTLLPGFIDAHSHLSAVANSFLQLSLDGARNFHAIQQDIAEYIRTNRIPKGKWVICKGYDHNMLAERRHPYRELLDAAAPDNPVVIQHQSGHMGVLNTSALSELQITEKTVPPQGGTIGKTNGVPNGYLEENAFIETIKKLPTPDLPELLSAYQRAQQKYASYGVTTIQDGMAVKEMVPVYQTLTEKRLLQLDTVVYPGIGEDILLDTFPNAIRQYDRRLKIGGYKIFLDGSPQGKTAWMKTPYKTGDGKDTGYGTLKDEEVLFAVEKAIKNNMQLLAHCNGDAACEQYLVAAEKTPGIAKIRPVIIHAQLLQPEQMDAVKRTGMIPSFFIGHVYYWGDTHIQNFGLARAEKISPAASALEKGILFTFHQDSPVTEPNMLETVWCAVNRMTKTGKILGASEKIPVLAAIQAVTCNAAYQYFEENEKGSLSPGKTADLVLLDQNPLKTAPEKINQLRVVRTVKNGQTIFEA